MGKTTAVRWQARDDVLTSVLRSLRLQGSVFCRAELSAPWGLELEAQDYAHFHVMERGNAWLRLKGEKRPQPLLEGDLVLVPHGRGHVLTDAPGTRPVPLGSLVKRRGPGDQYNVIHFGGDGAEARLGWRGLPVACFAPHPC